MKSNELRIGNYVELRGEIAPVIKITNGRVEINGINKYLHDIGLLDPIPLTEEWLIKFGFEKIGLNYRLLIDFKNGFKELVLYFNTREQKFFVKANNYLVEILYIHKLQNFTFETMDKELILKQ